jgi:hypothetical protein
MRVMPSRGFGVWHVLGRVQFKKILAGVLAIKVVNQSENNVLTPVYFVA